MTVSTCTEKEYLKFKIVFYTLVKSSICRCLIQIIRLKKIENFLESIIERIKIT